MPDFRICECGAWRPISNIDRHEAWVTGCRACDEIRRLRQLLGEGIHVYEGESAETLRGKLDMAEAEIERLNQLLTTS